MSSYNYVLNNPVNGIDPDGMEAETFIQESNRLFWGGAGVKLGTVAEQRAQEQCCPDVDLGSVDIKGEDVGYRLIKTALWEFRHSVLRLWRNSPIGRWRHNPGEGMKWSVDFKRNEFGNAIWETEIKAVLSEGFLIDKFEELLDGFAIGTVGSGNIGTGIFARSVESSAIINEIRWSVKGNPEILELARETFKGNSRLSQDVSHVILQLAQGNMNPGIGTKRVFDNVFEARTRHKGRVYFTKEGNIINILAYSNKETQQKVINKLIKIHQ